MDKLCCLFLLSLCVVYVASSGYGYGSYGGYGGGGMSYGYGGMGMSGLGMGMSGMGMGMGSYGKGGIPIVKPIIYMSQPQQQQQPMMMYYHDDDYDDDGGFGGDNMLHEVECGTWIDVMNLLLFSMMTSTGKKDSGIL